MDYPSSRADRDRWVLAQRGPRGVHDARRHGGWLWETEAGPGHAVRRSLTLFLTNRECPWRCVFCDLWKHTLPDAVRPGDIPHQIRTALHEAGSAPEQVKLYNAGSFFDDGAIPPEDDALIAALVGTAQCVVVESHPRRVGDRTWRLRDLLRSSGGAELEVAMGLETAHPEVLERLNKGVTLDDFSRAAAQLRREGIRMRAFVLIQPPFEDPELAVSWAVRSAAFAFDQGIARVALIPVRGGNGAMEQLRAGGHWSPPGWPAVEAAMDQCLQLNRGWVDVDSWDLDRLPACPECGQARRERLQRMSQVQRSEPPVACSRC